MCLRLKAPYRATFAGLNPIVWHHREETQDKLYHRVKYNSVQLFEPIYIDTVYKTNILEIM